MPKALGLVETRGLVAAIEAADAMVKTSNVTLVGREVTRPALVTVKVVGEVAAVKASVDAGAAAAEKVGTVVSIHVIPQPDSQMEYILPEIKDDKVKRKRPVKESKDLPEKKPPEVVSKKEIETPSDSGTVEKKSEVKATVEIKKPSETENHFTETKDHLERLRREALGIKEEKTKADKIKEDKKQKGKSSAKPLSIEELEKLNVHQLRKQARATEGFPIQGRAISKANRKKLLDFFKKLT
jgi:ethanolamine utilization protein EutM